MKMVDHPDSYVSQIAKLEEELNMFNKELAILKEVLKLKTADLRRYKEALDAALPYVVDADEQAARDIRDMAEGKERP